MFWRYNYQGIIWALVILLMCGLPGEQFEKSKLENADMAVHAVMFGVLFFLLAVGFIKQSDYKGLRRHTLFKVFVICAVYGVLVELLQGSVFVDRSIEASDMLFNALGALMGMGVFGAIYGIRPYL